MSDAVVRAIEQLQALSSGKKGRGWFYLDDEARIQGPFRPSVMAAWHAVGHLHANLLVRFGNSGVFVPLGTLGNPPFGTSAEDDLIAAHAALKAALEQDDVRVLEDMRHAARSDARCRQVEARAD